MKKILTFIIAALSALSLSACAATIGENVPEENPAALPYDPPAPEVFTLEKLDNSFCELLDAYFGDSVGSIELYLSPDDLDTETITSRMENNTVIVEREIGIVLNAEGDGRVINIDGEYNYISYRHVGFDAPENTVIVTYIVFTPDSGGEDDFMGRWDFPIFDRNTVIGGESYGY